MKSKQDDYWQKKRERMRRVTREFVRKCRQNGIDPYSIGKTGSMKMEKR